MHFSGNRRSRPSQRRWLRRIALLALAGLGLTWLPVVILRFLPPPTSAFMVERKLAAWRDGEHGFAIKQRFVPLTDISPELPIALVAAEDQKFPHHHGFDFEAIGDAMDDADDGARLRGASTISQQTAKNLFLWNGRSFVRKGLEAYFTVLLELTWPKSRIIEVYANVAQFGDGIYGVEAAAQTFFGKSARQLTAHESALLAASLPNPVRLRVDRPSAYQLKRAAWIERQVRQLGGAGYLER